MTEPSEQSKHLTIGRYWAIIKRLLRVRVQKKPYEHGQAAQHTLDLRRETYGKVLVNIF
jgi:hypothetical protein